MAVRCRRLCFAGSRKRLGLVDVWPMPFPQELQNAAPSELGAPQHLQNMIPPLSRNYRFGE